MAILAQVQIGLKMSSNLELFILKYYNKHMHILGISPKMLFKLDLPGKKRKKKQKKNKKTSE